MSTKFTTPDKILKEKIGGREITILQKLTPDFAVSDKEQCSYVPKGGYVKENALLNNGTGKPKGITVHNTPEIEAEPGTDMAEQYQRATYPNCNMRGVAVHYWVWHDVIWQQLRDDEQGWHAADGSTPSRDHRGNMSNGNMDTISIECIGPDRESEETLILLVACLCRRHGLDPTLDVYTHNYWMHGGDRFFENVGKNCPLYILPHWDRFLAEVKEAYDSDKKEEK